MAAFFFDSSALVKRFARETGSAWVFDLIKPSHGHTIYIARITAVEVVSAIVRRMRAGSIASAAANKALSRLERSLLLRYAFVEIHEPLITRAMQLAKAHALRGYDAVQLSAALNVNDGRLKTGASSITLISADEALNSAAIAEGLQVDNPNLHP